MLDDIKIFLSGQLTEQRVEQYIDALVLIYNYNFTSPIETINDILLDVDNNGIEHIIYIITNIVDESLTQLLNSHFILTKGDFVFKFKVLQALSLLEHYIDSDVIVSIHDDDIEPKEMLIQYILLVTNIPIELLDTNLVDVRAKLITKLYDKHLDIHEANVQEDVIPSPNLKYQRAFASKYPTSLGVRLIQSGEIKLSYPVNTLILKYQEAIYELTQADDIALTIYSLVVISDTSYQDYIKVAMDIVNNLYNDLQLISSVNYFFTNYKIVLPEGSNVY